MVGLRHVGAGGAAVGRSIEAGAREKTSEHREGVRSKREFRDRHCRDERTGTKMLATSDRLCRRRRLNFWNPLAIGQWSRGRETVQHHDTIPRPSVSDSTSGASSRFWRRFALRSGQQVVCFSSHVCGALLVSHQRQCAGETKKLLAQLLSPEVSRRAR